MHAAARTLLRPHRQRGHPRRRRGEGRSRLARAGGGLVALALPAILGAGWLHTELEESDPAEDAVLAESPSRVTLTYTTDVQLALSTVEVRPALPNATTVPAGKPAYLADDRRDVIVLPLSEPLGGGGYTVSWTTAGPDGHKLSGDFGFRVDLPAEETREEAPGTVVTTGDSMAQAGDAGAEGNPQAGGADSESDFAFGRTLHRFALYLGILALLGAVAFRLLVLGRFARAGGSREVVVAATRRVWLVGGLGLGILLVLLPIRLLHRAAAFFPDDPLGNLFTVAAGTPWAVGWWLQVVSALLVAGGLLVAGKGGSNPAGWKIVVLGALLAPLVPVLSGHGWSDDPRALSAAATYLHVVAAGGWVGGLLCLVFAGFPALRERGGAAPATEPGLADLVGAFSRVAQVAVALLLVTGAVKVWIHIGSLSDLWTTAWGRSLLVKDAVVAGVLALGFYNWRFVRPALERNPRYGLIRNPAMIELLLGAAAVAVTSYLVAQPLS